MYFELNCMTLITENVFLLRSFNIKCIVGIFRIKNVFLYFHKVLFLWWGDHSLTIAGNLTGAATTNQGGTGRKSNLDVVLRFPNSPISRSESLLAEVVYHHTENYTSLSKE